MGSKSKILATVSLIGLMSIASVHVANATDADILEQLRILQERLDSQAKQIDALRNINDKRVRASDAQAGKILSQAKKLSVQNKKIDKQSKQIKSLRYRDSKLFSQAKKNGDKRSNEALSNEALFNVGMPETGVFDAIFEAVDEHESNLHSSKLRIGGWSDFEYLNTNQTAHKQFFNPSHLYLFFDAKMNDEWRVYNELEFEGSPLTETNSPSKGAIALERSYVEYTYSTRVKAKFGKFNTPLGIWTPEHWLINVPSIVVPIHESNLYIQPKAVGIQVFGDYFTSSKSEWAPDFHYNIWTSNGADVFGTDGPTDGKLGYGGNLSAMFNDLYKFGLTIYAQNAVTAGGAASTVKEFTFMPYTQLKLPYNVTLTGEYMRIDRDNNVKDIDTWYASAQWWFNEKSYLYYRHDFGDDVKSGNGATQAADVFTLGYWPKSYVRAKFEWSTHNFNDKTLQDYDEWGASIGIVF